MRVLFVIPAYHPAQDFGGPIPVARDFARRLRDRGHEVVIWTANLATSKEKLTSKTFEDEVDGIRVVYFNSVLRYRWVGITPGVFRYALREVKDFDVVHIFGYREFLPVAVAFWARWIGKPYVLQALGTVAPVARSLRKKRVYDALVGREVLKNASALIAKGDVEREQYLRAGAEKHSITVIPNGMEVPAEIESLKPGAFREKHGIGFDEPLILFLGRIHRVKGVDLLIQAFTRLPDRRSRLVVAGPDEGLRGQLERVVADEKLEDRVTFTGALYDESKWEAYLDADIYVLPSLFENFPRTVLEAMSCRTPVIITDRCGIASQVEDRGGIVVPYDEAELARAMDLMVKDEELRRKLSEGGLRLIREEFSWEKPVAELEQLYERVKVGTLA